MPLARGAANGYFGLRHYVAIDEDVVRSRPAHAKRAPGVNYPDVRRVHRNGKMQNRWRLALAFKDDAGHQHVTAWGASAKTLRAVMR
jgi:hypothetical protein